MQRHYDTSGLDAFITFALKNRLTQEPSFVHRRNIVDCSFVSNEYRYQVVVISDDAKHILVSTKAAESADEREGFAGLPISDDFIHGSELIGVLDDKIIGVCRHGSSVFEGCQWLPIKAAYMQLNSTERSALSFALQRHCWLNEYRFCVNCGGRLVENNTDGWEEKRCSQCEKVFYPPISPCVVVSVIGVKGVLLVRAHHYETGRYSVVAGFVEAGESAEHCARREVHEETGVHLGSLAYIGSQSWPFPKQLMLGYLALLRDDQEKVELKVQASELSDARWFKPDYLPNLPPQGTLSRRLIDLSLEYWQLMYA